MPTQQQYNRLVQRDYDEDTYRDYDTDVVDCEIQLDQQRRPQSSRRQCQLPKQLYLKHNYSDEYDNNIDDDEDDEDDEENGMNDVGRRSFVSSSSPSIVSITVSRQEQPDGSIVRVKETFLSDGTSRREEQKVGLTPQSSQVSQVQSSSKKVYNNNKSYFSPSVLPSLRRSTNFNSETITKPTTKKVHFSDLFDTVEIGFGNVVDNDDDDSDDEYDYDYYYNNNNNKHRRRDSLRIWPISALETQPEPFMVVPHQHTLRQSSDTRLRFYITVLKYLIIFMLIVFGCGFAIWFVVNHHHQFHSLVSYIRNMINQPR